jgi:hypothetical protein
MLGGAGVINGILLAMESRTLNLVADIADIADVALPQRCQ